jgi:drug/metabolite transporter (DMT)-like permease
MHHVMFIAVCLIWGSNFILMKWAYAAFGPFGVAAGRVLGGAAVLWVFWALRDKATRFGPRNLSKGDWLALIVPVAIGSVYPYVMQPYLIGKYQESAFFAMMVSLVPLLTVLASVPLLRVLPMPRELVGVLVGLACMLMLLRDGEMRGMSVWDLCLAAGVPTCYALSNTYVKRRLSGMPPLFMTAMILGLTSLIVTPVGAAAESVKPVDGYVFWQALVALAWLGVIGTGLAAVMFYRLIQTHGPLYAGMVAYVIPLGALVWGWLDHETVTTGQLVALGGVFAAVAMVQWKPKPREAQVSTFVD